MSSLKGINTASVAIREESSPVNAMASEGVAASPNTEIAPSKIIDQAVIDYADFAANSLKSRVEKAELLVIDELEGLREYAEEISALACTALEPNIFYDPCLLFPALETYAKDTEITFLLVYAARSSDQQDRTLIGFFPFEVASKFRGLPIRNLRLWRYPHCFLATPLLHPDYAGQAIATALDWAHSDKRIKLLDFTLLTGDPKILQHIKQFTADHDLQHCFVRYERAMMTRFENAVEYFDQVLKRKRQKDFIRQFRNLGEKGELKWQQLGKLESPEQWINDFLELESSGWKGKKGTALNCADFDSEFFRTAVNAAHREGRLITLSLLLDDRPIAMIVLFNSGTGTYAFKMAYAEQYRRYSPGFQMTMELIRRCHGRNDVSWIDFCADPDHLMSLRLMNARKPLINITIAMESTLASKLVRFMPMLKNLKNRIKARS